MTYPHTKLLRIHPADDLAVALVDLPADAEIPLEGGSIRLRADVPAKHKVYLHNLPAAALPKMYGLPVGRTSRPVRRGDVVSPDNLLALHDPADRLSPALPPWTPPDPAGLPTHFAGYRRPDGQTGTRNYLLVVHTIVCTRHIAGRIVSAARQAFGFDPPDPWVTYLRTGQLPSRNEPSGYPGVDDIVMVHHHSGCGVDRVDVDTLLRFLAGHINHPNVAGAVVLGLGCEKTPPQRLRSVVGETWKPVVYLTQQSLGREDSLIRSALDALKEMLPVAAAHRREPVPASRLVLGLQCGGSDGFSGITANPALGVASDLVTGQGGTVILPETPEMYGGETILAARAVNAAVGEQVLQMVRGFAASAAATGAHPVENLSLGNIREGLTTIQMKSLGAILKAGNAPVSGVLRYTEPVPGPGLYLLDTPGYDVMSTSALVASGANIIAFTTGLGTPTGNPLVPVVKIASNSRTAQNMADVIDFDAGAVLSGETLSSAGRRLYRLMVETASGKPTCNERLNHRESDYWQQQAVL